MRQRPADLEAGLADRGQRIAAQRGAQGLDAFERQLREVGQRAVLDLAVLAIGLAQQERGAGVAIGDLGDVHEPSNQTDSASVKRNRALRLTTCSSGFFPSQVDRIQMGQSRFNRASFAPARTR